MKILVVEDQPKTGNYLKQGLLEAGFVVDLACDGEDGLHCALTEAYDLVILDVMLPGIDGWAVLQGIRKGGQGHARAVPDCPRPRRLIGSAAWNSGADDYLVKPFAFSELLARVRSAAATGRQGYGIGVLAGSQS
jgi:two-component system copper resistance phosphate regulon response regulator CusR